MIGLLDSFGSDPEGDSTDGLTAAQIADADHEADSDIRNAVEAALPGNFDRLVQTLGSLFEKLANGVTGNLEDETRERNF